MSSIDLLGNSILQNTVNASQQEINTLLKQLETGLKITSAGDDPANLYVSDKLNLEALENSSTSTNAQNGLTYLQIAQKGFSDIVTELTKIKDLANKALTGNYDSIQIADFQNQITESINAIKLIETSTTFNGIQVFNNSNSAALVNEHMFAVTSKTDVTVTTTTIIDNRGSDYSDYLSNDIDRYDKKDIGGHIALVNEAGGVIAFDAIHITTGAQFKAIVSGMTLGIGLDKNYILDTDINVGALGINTNGKALFQGNFIGTFDGNGHTISNLTINNTDASIDAYKTYYTCDDAHDYSGEHGVGVFDIISGSVANLNLSSINITIAGNVNRVGALAAVATNGATVSNVNVLSATLTGGTDSKGMGGLVGLVDNATISNSSANATITGAWSLGGLVGGLQNGGIIKNSSASGTVTCNQATLRTVDLGYTGSHRDRMTGGLVGYMTGATSLIDSSRSTTTVNSSHSYSGGFAGLVDGGYITNSYATGNVSAAGQNAVGGFAADIRGNATIINSYASNSVTGGTSVGGFYGQSMADSKPAGITNCFYNSSTGGATFGPAPDNLKWINSGGLTTAQITGHTGNFATYTAPWDADVWNLAAGAPTLKVVGPQAVTPINAADVTTIENAQELISALSGTTAGKTFILLDNIDLSSLGTQTQALIQPTFQGTLLGNGYAISGLSINSTGNNVGLFNSIGATGKVQDLILTDFTVKGNINVGSLAGGVQAGGVVQNVATLDAKVSGNMEVGALLGYVGGTLSDAYATGTVSGDSISTDIGGLAGKTEAAGRIARSFANVNVTGGSNVGGLVGHTYNTSLIFESYARGSVTGVINVGGLVGNNASTNATSIQNSYALGDVTGNTNTAGLVGLNSGNVSNSYSLSKVTDSTTVTDVANFTVVATGEIIQGIDERPSDDYSITYTATTARGGVGNVYAFSSQTDFETFKLWDVSGTVPSKIGMFYQKAAANVWQGKQIGLATTYTYTQVSMGDTSVGKPVDSDGGNYSVVQNIGGSWFAFASQDDYNNYSTYNSGAAPAAGITRFYKLTNAANNEWTRQSLTVNTATDYVIGVSTDPSNVANTPLVTGTASGNGEFNFLYTNAGNDYAFASAEDRDKFIAGNAPVDLYYQLTSTANNTWTAYKITQTYTPVAFDTVPGGTSVDIAPNDVTADYDVIKSLGGATYAFASEEDFRTFAPDSTNIAPNGAVQKYYKWDTGSNQWNAYTTTATPVHTQYAVTGNATYVSGAPKVTDSNEEYSFIKDVAGNTYAFASEEDYRNFTPDNGATVAPKAAIAKYFRWNSADDVWDSHTIVASTTATTYDLSTVGSDGGTVHGVPRDSQGEYTYLNGDYAFSSQEDLDTWNSGNGTIAKYYLWDHVDKWYAYSSVVSTAAHYEYDINTTGMGGAVAGAPGDSYNGIYNIFRTGTDGYRYAFASETDATNWNDGNTLATIGRFYKWNDPTAPNLWKAYSVVQAGNHVTYNYSSGGDGVIIDAVPKDPNGVSYSFQQGDYRFSSQQDLDNWNNGSPMDTISSFYYYNSGDGKWYNYSVEAYQSIVPVDAVFSAPIDALGNIYSYTTTVGANQYFFANEADKRNFNDGVTFFGDVGKFYSSNISSAGNTPFSTWSVTHRTWDVPIGTVDGSLPTSNASFSYLYDPNDGFNYAFESMADALAYANKTSSVYYYKADKHLGAGDNWQLYYTSLAGASSGDTVAISPVDPDMQVIRKINGSYCAFATEQDAANWDNYAVGGTFTGGIDKFYLFDGTATWNQFTFSAPPEDNWDPSGGVRSYVADSTIVDDFSSNSRWDADVPWSSSSDSSGHYEYFQFYADPARGGDGATYQFRSYVNRPGQIELYKWNGSTYLYRENVTATPDQFFSTAPGTVFKVSEPFDNYGGSPTDFLYGFFNSDLEAGNVVIDEETNTVKFLKSGVTYFKTLASNCYEWGVFTSGAPTVSSTGSVANQNIVYDDDYTYSYSNAGLTYYFQTEKDYTTHYQLTVDGGSVNEPTARSFSYYYTNNTGATLKGTYNVGYSVSNLALYGGNPIQVAGSRPPDEEYQYTYNTGMFVYAFSSESDMDNYIDWTNNYDSFKDQQIVYYRKSATPDLMNPNTWTKFSLTSGYQLGGEPGSVAFAPNDVSYGIALDVGVDGYFNGIAGRAASGAGFYYFQTDSDKNAFKDYIYGSTSAIDVNYYFMADDDGIRDAGADVWTMNNLSYGNPDSLHLSVPKFSTVSKPIDPAYSYYDAGSGRWFKNKSESDIVNTWDHSGAHDGLDGTNMTFPDIYWYQHTAGETVKWVEYWLKSNSTPGTTTVGGGFTEGTNPYSGDNLYNHYAWLDIDGAGGRHWYFASDSDRQTATAIANGTINYGVDNLVGFYDVGVNQYQKATITSTFHDNTYNFYNYLGDSQRVDSKADIAATPNDNYDFSYVAANTNYGFTSGIKYWFASESDARTAEAINKNQISYPVEDIVGYYYLNNSGLGGTYQRFTIKSDPGDTTYPPTARTGWVFNKPNDIDNPNNNYVYNFTATVDTDNNNFAVGTTYWFASESDLATAKAIYNNTIDHPVDNLVYYTWADDTLAGGRWRQGTITTSALSSTTYAAGTASIGNVTSRPYDAVNKTDYDTYQYILALPTSANGIDSGTYYFANQSDKDTVAAINAGLLTHEINNIVAYSFNPGTDKFDKILFKSIPDSTVTNPATLVGTADAYSGRVEKEGYDRIHSYGGSIYAFANETDWATWNNGNPSGTIDLYYKWDSAGRNWDSQKVVKNTLTAAYTYNNALGTTAGTPTDDEFRILYQSGGIWYAFKDSLDRTNFQADVLGDGLEHSPIDKYYRYTAATNTWSDYTMVESSATAYSVIDDNSAPLDNKTGLGYKPILPSYPNLYLLTLAGANAGTYAFTSKEDRDNFVSFDAGAQGVASIENFYKLNATTQPDRISGKAILDWSSQKLEYQNNVGYLVGKSTAGAISNSFFGTGANSANYTVAGETGVTMLGNTQIASHAAAPYTGWAAGIWDWTSTNKPILRNTKAEGSEELDESNLVELDDETQYVFHIHDDYNTTNIWLNTALTSWTTTQSVASSAPVGTDAAGRPLVLSMVLTGITNKYISDFTVSDNANPNTRYTEGKDFVLYTNDNGASWKMDVLSSSMYGKTLKIDYAGAATNAANQANSGFDVYLGDNKALNVRDMTLDLAGRLNFNITREEGSRGTLEALNDTLQYMKTKQSLITGEIKTATAALSNKTAQTTTMTTAVKHIVSVDEAKAKAELAKKQLLQSKTDTILQKFYDLQTASMQSLLNTSFNGGNTSAYGNIYSSLKGVNNIYNQNVINYNYRSLFDLFE